YVGCIAGAIPIEEYREGLKGAGFAHVEIIDSGADLNAYAQIEGQVGCCGSEMTGQPVTVEPASCCTPAPAGSSACCTPTEPVAIESVGSCCSPATNQTPELISRLAELVRRHDINDYAASVKVFAVKP